MSVKSVLEDLHPPPSVDEYLEKNPYINKTIKVSFRIEENVLKEKMNLAGYTNRSLFLRELVMDWESNDLNLQVEQINERLDHLMNLMSDKRLHQPNQIKTNQNHRIPEKILVPTNSNLNIQPVSAEKKTNERSYF